MDQKVALVTGSGRGIGKGIAIVLARAGYDVCVHYNQSAGMAEDTVRTIEALGRYAVAVQGDIRTAQGVSSLFEQFSQHFNRLDLHVNNSGVTRMAPFLETTPELFDEVVDTDLKGLFFCSQKAARMMVEKGTKGVIINISSNHAEGSWANSTVYAAAKAGVNKLTKNMALDLSAYGIRVVGIAPGYTRLEWVDEQKIQKQIDAISPKIPLRRFATPDEIGEAVAFLASDKAGYITGTTLYIDGGALLPVWANQQ